MAESLKIKAWRLVCNLLFPAYAGTGGWIEYIADDFKEVRVRLKLSWRTRNYVGTIFGGSMYAAIDPFYMIMLLKNLGKDYVVWDKAANIRFKKPGRETLYAHFKVTEEDLVEIKQALETEKKLDKIYNLELVNKEGVVHAAIEKTVYIAKKESERQARKIQGRARSFYE